MNMTRLRIAALFRLVRQLFAVRSSEQHSSHPVPDDPIAVSDEQLAAGLCLVSELLGPSELAVLEVLRKARIEIRRAGDWSDIPRLLSERMPDFVITGAGSEAARVAHALSEAGYKGPLQPVGAASPEGVPPLPGLRVLPAIPVEAIDAELFAILQEDGMARGVGGAVTVDLGIAVRRGWLQFWYQPKIDLRRGRLQGVELIPRIHHPRHGILDQDSFEAAGADDRRILGFSAVRAAMKDWAAFLHIGFNMEFAVNFPVDVFDGREVAALVDGIRPGSRRWEGLRIELDASKVAPRYAHIDAFRHAIRARQVKLVLDHVVSAEQVANVDGRFAEVKLDSSLVAGCADNRDMQNVLLSIQAQASRTEATLVASGIGRRIDLEYIQTNLEDVKFGQGPVFSPVVSRARFIRLLLARANHASTRHLQQARVPAVVRPMEK